jgi:DNA-binding transcriptional regulator YiaG
MAWKPDEIRDLREALGLTQAQFAKKLRTTRFQVSRWEQGKQKPTPFFERKLDKLLAEISAKYNNKGDNPASPLEGNLHQSKEDYAWTKEAIQSFRMVQGWTQAQFAQACATTQQIVAQWETGKFSPDEEHKSFLDKLANQLVFQRQMKESGLKALQKRLNALDIPEELFNQYIALVASRRWQYIMDNGYGWFEAKRNKDGEPWPVPDIQIADHLAGHEWDGTATREYIFQTQPSSFAVGLKADYKSFIVDIDLDKEFIQHPSYDPIFNPFFEKVNIASGLVMYERMQAIVELFPESLVLRRPESGNLSVIFRIVPIPNWKMLKLVEKLLLVECDMEINDGEVEIFQRKDRARRLPFNGAQAVIEKESMPWKIRPLGLNKRQSLSALVNLPMIDLEALITEIAQEEIKQKQEKQRQPDFESHFKCAAASASPFVLHCLLLLKHGLTKPKSRHAAETDLILYFFLIGRTCEETYKRISFWYQSGKTNGYSKDWANHPQKVLRDLRTHVKSYYRWLDQRGFTPYMSACDGSLRSKLESERSELAKLTNAKPQAGGDGIDPEAKLSLSDVAYIAKVTGSDLHFGEWLFDLFVYAKQRKFTLSYLYLSQRIMQSFKNGSHN